MSPNDHRKARYLNNAGAALPSDTTLRTQIEFLQDEAKLGATVAAAQAQQGVREFYDLAAELVGESDPTRIAYMDSASRAWDMALYGSGLSNGDRIVTLSSEFGTNLISLHHYAAQVGAEVDILPVNLDGTFDLARMRDLVEGSALVAISHVAAHGSIVNPVEAIGNLCRQFGTTYLVDGCQALGQFRVDVHAIDCDAYTATGRKWLAGPRGTGFLYVRSGSRFRTPYVDLANAALVYDGTVSVRVNETAKQFELWERSVAGLLGLSSAIRETMRTLADDQLAKSWQDAATRLRASVVANPKLTLIGEPVSQSHITGLIAERNVMDHLLREFEQIHLAVSVMGRYDAPVHLPDGATRIIRLAPHYYTPLEVVDAAIEVIENA
jgi:selenocysteine lyase/cysteine desulfurase